MACAVAFAFGVFLFTLSATTDIKEDVKLLNQDAKTLKNGLSTLKHLSKFIDFHSTTKELSNYLSRRVFEQFVCQIDKTMMIFNFFSD